MAVPVILSYTLNDGDPLNVGLFSPNDNLIRIRGLNFELGIAEFEIEGGFLLEHTDFTVDWKTSSTGELHGRFKTRGFNLLGLIHRPIALTVEVFNGQAVCIDKVPT